MGEREPLRLRRAWRTSPEQVLAPPVLSPDGELACVPLHGPTPGLFVVAPQGDPRRLTEGRDYDPRWNDRHILFYRLEQQAGSASHETRTRLLHVERPAA